MILLLSVFCRTCYETKNEKIISCPRHLRRQRRADNDVKKKCILRMHENEYTVRFYNLYVIILMSFPL